MEVKEGYKMTEVGIIPEDWEVVPLSQITSKIGSGKTPLGGANVYQSEGHVFVRSQNVGWGHYLLDDVVFISDDIHQNQISSELHEGDVLLNITGASIGRSVVVNDSLAGGNVNQHVCIIRLKDKKNSSEYLCYYILSSNIQNLIKEEQAGGSREALNFKQIGAFNITRPENPTEQTAIAEALSDTDSLIASLDKLITKKKNIKQGAMQNLLTGKVRHEGYNDKWVRKKISSFADITTGSQNTQDKVDDGIYPFYVRSQQIERINKYIFDTEGIITAGDGVGTGKVFHYVNGKFGLHQRAYLIYNFVGVDAKFFFWIFSKFFYERIHSLTAKSSVDSVRKDMIADMEVFIPSNKDEQTAIADILFDIEKEIEYLQQKRDKYIAIKEGMMQQLLTGKIRLE